MNSDSKKELAVGMFFLVLSAAYIIGTRNISTFTPFGNRGLDSRSVPLLIGGLTLFLAVVHIMQVIIKELKARKDVQEQSDDRQAQVCDQDEVVCVTPPQGRIIARIDRVVPVKLIGSLAFLVIFVASFQRAGFIISSTFFLLAESLLLVKQESRKKWIPFILIYAVGVSVLVYFIFTRYLSLFLPRGILG